MSSVDNAKTTSNHLKESSGMNDNGSNNNNNNNKFWYGIIMGGGITITTSMIVWNILVRRNGSSSITTNITSSRYHPLIGNNNSNRNITTLIPNNDMIIPLLSSEVPLERFSYQWWKQQFTSIIFPHASLDALRQQQQQQQQQQLFLQQQQQQEAAAAAQQQQQQIATTTSIVNSTIQAALGQFQKELQTQLLQDRNQSTIQLYNTIQQQERTITQSLGQPIYTTKQQINNIQEQITSLQHLFTLPKTRGTIGEIQLELLIQDVLPSSMYTIQYTLSNQKRVDCMLHLPQPIGNISIDSKFPSLSSLSSTTSSSSLPTAIGDDSGITEENNDDTTNNKSTLLNGSNNSMSQQHDLQVQQEQQNHVKRKKEIRDKLQKHIHDIATKYIIPGETSQHAICFIPSVSLFIDIVNDHMDVLLLAHKYNVWITCPTTLLAVLTTIQGISRGQIIAQQTTNIFALITKLNKDIDLLVNRFENAEKSIERTRTELSKMQISVHKIQKVKMELNVLSSQVTTNTTAKSSSSSSSNTPSLPIQEPDNDDIDVNETSNDENDVIHHQFTNIETDMSASIRQDNDTPTKGQSTTTLNGHA